MRLGTAPLLALVLLSLKASCFRLRRVQLPANIDKRHSADSLKRRYWNDELQPCIEKYCSKYVHTKWYVTCLSKYCQEGLLATVRDVRDPSNSQEENSGSGELLSLIQSGKSGELRAFCAALPCGATGAPYGQDPYQMSKVDILRGIIHNLCLSFCPQQPGSSNILVAEVVHKRGGDDTFSFAGGREKRDKELMRKRRINEDVSQCIQSYCGQKHLKQRLVCIVKHCHRVGARSRG